MTPSRRLFLQSVAGGALGGLTGSLPPTIADDDHSTSPLTDRLNPTMQTARDTALNILKPSPKELERGLRLHADQNSAAEQRKVPRVRRGREEFRSLWPADDFQTTSKMTESLAWTNWPLFTVGLVQRGHSDEDIRKILGENVLRVARETLARLR
jgi:hypothetical protein